MKLLRLHPLFILSLLPIAALSLCKSLFHPNGSYEDLKNVPIAVGLFEEEDVAFFNEMLNANDIVYTWGADNPQRKELLERIKGPKISIGAKCIPGLEAMLEALKDLKFDYLNYNPEIWGLKTGTNKTPKEEIDDLLAAVVRARQLALQNGVDFSFCTDYILMEKFGEQIAPMVDLFVIQMQRYQTDSLKAFRDEARKKVSIVRNGSENVPIMIQLSMAPPLREMRMGPDSEQIWVPVRDEQGHKVLKPLKAEIVLEQIKAIKDLVAGIAFLYTKETRDEMKRLITILRE